MSKNKTPKWIVLSAKLRIWWPYTLLRIKNPSKWNILGLILNYIGWWDSCYGDLRSTKYPSMAIAPRSTMLRISSTCKGSICCSNSLIWKLFVLHRNTWKLFVLDRNTWKLFVLDWNTWKLFVLDRNTWYDISVYNFYWEYFLKPYNCLYLRGILDFI